MFTLIKKTSVHKDTKVVSNQKYDAILGRIYTISHLLSLERHNRISKTSPFVKVFLVAILRSYGYAYCGSPVRDVGGNRDGHATRQRTCVTRNVTVSSVAPNRASAKHSTALMYGGSFTVSSVTSTPGTGNKRIRSCVKALLKKLYGDFTKCGLLI